MVSVSGSWPAEIAVIQINSKLYRVVKSEVEPTEPPLLGFIQQVGDLFETTAVGQPLRRSYWATLARAVEELEPREADLARSIDSPRQRQVAA